MQYYKGYSKTVMALYPELSFDEDSFLNGVCVCVCVCVCVMRVCMWSVCCGVCVVLCVCVLCVCVCVV